MGTKPDAASWDPDIQVSFPNSFNYAAADVKHEHNGVSFATAHGLVVVGSFNDGTLSDERVTAYFISDNLYGGVWYRVAESDYRMILARCKAEPTSKLYVSKSDDRHINAVFRPSTYVEPDEPGCVTWVEPSADEEDVTVIRARILKHTEAA